MCASMGACVYSWNLRYASHILGPEPGRSSACLDDAKPCHAKGTRDVKGRGTRNAGAGEQGRGVEGSLVVRRPAVRSQPLLQQLVLSQQVLAVRPWCRGSREQLTRDDSMGCCGSSGQSKACLMTYGQCVGCLSFDTPPAHLHIIPELLHDCHVTITYGKS